MIDFTIKNAHKMLYIIDMVKIFTAPTCSSCRKVKKWFFDQNIPFIEKNIFSAALNEKDLKEILQKSENGTDDIIATKSKTFKEHKVDINSMTITELISFIKEHPSILKRPIIVDDTQIQVGFNEDDITLFIPKARRFAMDMCSKDFCPKFDNCDHVKDN